MSQVSTHAGQNRDVCLSTHGRLPGTLYSTRGFFWEYLGLQCKVGPCILATSLTIPLRFQPYVQQSCSGIGDSRSETTRGLS